MLVNATPPNGMDVSTTPTLPPACWNDCAVCSAARLDEGEIPYPYVASTLAPCDLKKTPACVLTGYFEFTLPASAANMLV